MAGFGHFPFGSFPFGHADWSRTVLYRMLPQLHQREDLAQGGPLALLVEGERTSFDILLEKIQRFGYLRDPLVARSQYDETVVATLGKQLITKGNVLQRGFNGKLTAFGEFISTSARFSPNHAGKDLEISRSLDPSHNQVVTIAQVDPATPTTAAISPPLSADPGPLAWELRDAAVETGNQTIVEVEFGDVSTVAPGWVVFDGFSEFEVLARTQLPARTEREGADGLLFGTSSLLTGTVTFTKGETTVTGALTQFLDEVVVGSYIKLESDQDIAYTKVAAVVNNTSLVLGEGYKGSSDSNDASYQFHRFVLALNQFTLEDIGKKLTIFESATPSNNDKYEIANVLRLHPSEPTYNGTTISLTGVVTFTNGSISVTGAGTVFLTQVTSGGYVKLTADGTSFYARVGSVSSNTALTLDAAYGGSSGSGAAQYSFDSSYRLAEIRRIGPSDSAKAGVPISSDAGPLGWAILGRPQLALKGRVQVVRGLLEQSGFDAAITAIGPRSGVAASITAFASGQVTLTGLSGMTADAVGTLITLSNAAIAANNGSFRIFKFISSSSVQITNYDAVFPDPNSGVIAWVTLKSDQVELEIPSGSFSPDLSGSTASITAFDGTNVTISGLSGMEPSCVGQQLIVTGADSAGNNSTASPFTIATFVSSTTVTYLNPDGFAPDVNNGFISWIYNSPDRGKLLSLRGPGANNGTVEIQGVTLSIVTVAQRVVPQDPGPDLSSPFTLDAGPLEWEVRTKTTASATDESPQLQQVQIRAPSLLQYLAKDFGIDVDIRESESRQRSWVFNNSRWIGIKGLAKAYEILGSISGFIITPQQLFHITQDLAEILPSEFLYETGEYAVGRSAPNPSYPNINDPSINPIDGSLFARDGNLLVGTSGRIRFHSETARFKPTDVGREIRIQLSLVGGGVNNKLYTIESILPPGLDGFFRDVEFRITDTPPQTPVTIPDPQNGTLQWNLTRLYTTQAPLRPRFDDLDPDLMGQTANPQAVLYFSGATASGDILYVAQTAGTYGNGVRIRHVSTGALSVSVTGTDVTVTFNAGVTTANAVAAAVAGFPAAAALLFAIPESGGTGFVTAHGFDFLVGGANHFAIDKFCWEDTFDSQLNGHLPFMAIGASASGNILYQAGVDGGYGLRITHVPVIGGPLSFAVDGDEITVRYNPGVTTANDVSTAILADVTLSSLLIATPQSGGTGFLSPTHNAQFNIISVAQTAENLWTIVVSGPLNVVQDVKGSNWRITDENGIEFFLESVPVASGLNWAVTTFSAIEPAVGLTLPSPIIVNYDCSPIFNCDYCPSNKVLLTMEAGDIFDDVQNTIALELILSRMLDRIGQVTPAHVETIVRFSTELVASFSLSAYVGTMNTLVAPFTPYFDEILGDVIPLDGGGFGAYVEVPDTLIGAITVGGPAATINGFVGLPASPGGQIVIFGAATLANNGSFPITSNTATTVSYTNAGAVSPDANDGDIGAILEEPHTATGTITVGGPSAVITGFTGLLAGTVGMRVYISGAATMANNGGFVITAFTATSVTYTNAFAVTPDAHNGSLIARIAP